MATGNWLNGERLRNHGNCQAASGKTPEHSRSSVPPLLRRQKLEAKTLAAWQSVGLWGEVSAFNPKSNAFAQFQIPNESPVCSLLTTYYISTF